MSRQFTCFLAFTFAAASAFHLPSVPYDDIVKCSPKISDAISGNLDSHGGFTISDVPGYSPIVTPGSSGDKPTIARRRTSFGASSILPLSDTLSALDSAGVQETRTATKQAMQAVHACLSTGDLDAVEHLHYYSGGEDGETVMEVSRSEKQIDSWSGGYIYY